MKCELKVENIIPKNISDEEMQEIICSKIANVIIGKEKEICTFVNQDEN